MIQTFDPDKPWMNNYQKNSEILFQLVLFVVWPFGAWLFSLFKANTKISYIIFFVFSLLLCWHMAPTGFSDRYDDFLGIMDHFISTNYTNDEILDKIISFFTFSDDASKELYGDLLIWFTKAFISDNYHFYFLFAAIPVSFCQLKCLRRITSDVRYRAGSFLALITIILFICPRDIITVQNPRFATGLWFFVYGIIFFFCDKQYKLWYLLIILLTPFFHSGMWFAVIIFVLYCVIPFKHELIKWILLISIPFSILNTFIVLDVNVVMSFFPEFLRGWAESYLSEASYSDHIYNEGRAGFWWISWMFKIIMQLTCIYMSIVLLRDKAIVRNNLESSRLYGFFLFFVAMVNFVQSIPVLGERYYWMLRIFIVFMWFKSFYPMKYKTMIVLLASSSFSMFFRYSYIYGGALSVCMPPDIFFSPLPYIVYKGFLY